MGTNHTANNLINNAKRFKTEGYTQRSEKNINYNSQLKSNALWTTDIKSKLLKAKDQSQKEGWEFMQRKRRWDKKHE